MIRFRRRNVELTGFDDGGSTRADVSAANLRDLLGIEAVVDLAGIQMGQVPL